MYRAGDVSSSLLPFAQAQHDNFPLTEEASGKSSRPRFWSPALMQRRFASPPLLKLDVQGYELTALQGCGVLLDRFQYVYVEASYHRAVRGTGTATEVIRFLFDRGFKLICVANLSRGASQRPIQADFLFSK